MRVEIRQNPERDEPVLILEVAERNAEAEALAERLRAVDGGVLMGWREGRAYRLDSREMVRFFAQEKEVFAEDVRQERYAVRRRLYELEEILDRGDFVRISHSEIVSLRQVKALDLKLSGTIQMTMKNGTVSYASRRYVKKIREALGL